MLDPDYLEQAGEMTASVYSQIEAEMLDLLIRRMIEGDISGQMSQTSLLSLSQGNAQGLLAVLNKHRGEIDDAVAEEVTKALRRSDNDDLSRIKRGMGVDLPSITTRQMAVTVAGIRDILARENLAMAKSAQTEFLNQATWAITQVNTGMMTTERALHMAVRRLEKQGLTLVSYRNTETGKQTVKNKVDVAVRRHIRTQIHQASMRRTEQVLDDAGVELVEVSSHGGARPSHAKWQGKVYSRNGDKVIDGVRYRDFKTACNWGDVADGIGGANCRHSYAAWFPGMKRMYEHEPEHPSGLSNDEVYELTQKQRAMERGIREAKRELRGAEQIYENDPSLANQANAARAKLVLKDRQAKLRQLVNENPKVLQRSPRREWAGDMPKVRKTARIPKVQKPKTPSTGKKIDIATSPEQAASIARKLGVHFADYSDIPMEAANACNRALVTLPEKLRPRSVTSAKALETAMDMKFGGKRRAYHGVTVKEEANFYKVTGNRADADFDFGWRVGINIRKGGTLDSIAKKKTEFNEQYRKQTGRTWYFNESGESVPFHEMGHVYAKQAGLPKGFEADAKRWASESKCDMLNNPEEAWAEAWGAYHTRNDELPDYIAKHIENATSDKVAKSKPGKGSGAFDGIGSFEKPELSKSEWAHVQSEIRTNLNEEQKKLPIVTKAIGDYVYTFENRWPEDAIIIEKHPIDPEW